MSKIIHLQVVVRGRKEDQDDLRTIITTALNKHGYTEHSVAGYAVPREDILENDEGDGFIGHYEDAPS